jgi:hypothetical protein
VHTCCAKSSGIEQEVRVLLVTYQALRTAIADAAATVPGTDPDRASFAIAPGAARDQVILAAGVTGGPAADLAGNIGRTRPALRGSYQFGTLPGKYASSGNPPVSSARHLL